MAHALSITDGTTTISLSSQLSTGIMLAGYTPRTATIRARSVTSGDGGEAVDPAYENVTDTIELLLQGANGAAVQAHVASIDQLLDKAKTRQTRRAGVVVYVQLQVDSEGSAYRSEILTGRVELADGALTTYGNFKVPARLIITRRYFWENTTETELQLSTSNQSAATGGRTIKNHDDSGTGDDNWVQIANGQVNGSLPTPARMTLTNNSGAGQAYRDIYIGTNAYSDPTSFAHVIEVESAGGSYGTVTALASCSAGNYLAKTFSATAGILMTIPAATLFDGAGRYFRVLMRLASTSGAFYVKPIVKDGAGLISLFVGDEVYITSEVPIADLGAIPVPPMQGGVSWAALTLYLEVRAASSVTVGFDFIQLTPTDSYVHLKQRGYTVANGEIITIDGIGGTIDANGQPLYTPVGMPLMLFPNTAQRLIFLHNEGTGAPDITNSFSVRVYYRQRRLTI